MTQTAPEPAEGDEDWNTPAEAGDDEGVDENGD